MNKVLKRAGNDDKGVKGFAHFLYSLYFDLRYHKHVRKQFLEFLGFSLLAWVAIFIMSGDDYLLALYVIPIILTIAFNVIFLVNYYSIIYPAITDVYRQIKLQSKYPTLYNSFLKESE